jgi:hypothetical protein
VFLSFYGDTTGLAHVSQLGLASPSDKPAAFFNVGQVGA